MPTGLQTTGWAENAFGGALSGESPGDKRLSARLVKSAALPAAHPGQTINASPAAEGSAVTGFCRMIEAPAESEVTVPNILAPHRARTVQRLRGQKTVPVIQDGTDPGFSRRPHCDGLQIIGRNQTAATALGLHLHATLAVTETGLPPGLCSSASMRRSGDHRGRGRGRRGRPAPQDRPPA